MLEAKGIFFGIVMLGFGLVIGWNIRQQTTIDALSIQSAKTSVTQERVLNDLDESRKYMLALLERKQGKNR